mgnify:CR=1 FL=1
MNIKGTQWRMSSMVLTIVAFTLGISTAVCAQQIRKSSEEAFDRIVNELNLNPSQQDQIAKKG